MSKVKLIFSGEIRKKLNCYTTEIEASSLEELITVLVERYGEDTRRLINQSRIMLNGYGIQFLSKPIILKDGDIIGIYTPYEKKETKND